MADAVSVEPRTKGVSYAVQIAEQRALAKGGQLEGALANLLQHEKTARLVRAPAPSPPPPPPPPSTASMADKQANHAPSTRHVLKTPAGRLVESVWQ